MVARGSPHAHLALAGTSLDDLVANGYSVDRQVSVFGIPRLGMRPATHVAPHFFALVE